MHPVHNVDRRLARAAALHRRLRDEEGVFYVDAAEYPARAAMAIVAVDKQGNSFATGSISTIHPETGEEAAIALAISSTAAKIIDSKTAIRNFEEGRISPQAQRFFNPSKG